MPVFEGYQLHSSSFLVENLSARFLLRSSSSALTSPFCSRFTPATAGIPNLSARAFFLSSVWKRSQQHINISKVRLLTAVGLLLPLVADFSTSGIPKRSARFLRFSRSSSPVSVTAGAAAGEAEPAAAFSALTEAGVAWVAADAGVRGGSAAGAGLTGVEVAGTGAGAAAGWSSGL